MKTKSNGWARGLCAAVCLMAGLLAAQPASAEPLEDFVVDNPIEWSSEREALTREYAQLHYGKDTAAIVPQAVVLHWTAGPTWESAYYTFYPVARTDGTVNVSSQFLVDRDGTVYRLLPETTLARHVIGYNWCAIGVENVGGEGGAEDLTDAQVAANVRLIRALHEKYPTIQYVFGHYQQTAARASGLYIEQVEGYHSIKSDPGPNFMEAVRGGLSGEGLTFYPE